MDLLLPGHAIRPEKCGGNIPKTHGPNVPFSAWAKYGGLRGRYADQSEKTESYIRDMEETFQTLSMFGMKLNPNKCVFWVRVGKFLRYMVTDSGVEVNLDKVQAIMDLKPLRNIKEVHVLMGILIALSIFIAQAVGRAHPFFKILTKSAKFTWDEKQMGPSMI